jgi:serine/threonine protein kinase
VSPPATASILSPAHRNRVRELFAEGVDTPAPHRAQWLDRRCEDLPAGVRDAVAGLLAAHDEAGNFLRDPTLAVPPDAGRPGADPDRPVTDAVPATLGPYTLGRELGRGGFGTVYLAEQADPLPRRVAVKLINPGMDTRQVVARFRAERQALARMDHPNIARVFDAGATPAGRPYFVMEWVDGLPIVAYARDRRLTVRQRLGLFVDVCRAIGHAHQRNVVHRDVKPSNVLVAELDGKPVPKVIDFGVAKAMGDPIGGLTAATDPGPFVGTPQYMSPEQADPAAGPLDTRADVYGLGVLLYELLTGRPPFDPAVLRRTPPADVARVVRDRYPVAPSRRVLEPPDEPLGGQTRVAFADAAPAGAAPADPSLANGSPADAAAARRRLARDLRGDLDWIVARATEKEPDRRYRSADALADDVLRHLGGLPVEAGPPSKVYRARKFVGRHRAMTAAVVAVVAAVAGGTALALAGWADADRSRDVAVAARSAEAAERVAAELGRAAARRGEANAVASEAKAVASEAKALAENAKLRDAQHLLHQFLFAPANRGQPPPVALLDYFAGELEAGTFRGRPELEAPFRVGLAQAYFVLPNQVEEARRHFVGTLAALDAAGPEADPVAYVTCHHNLGLIYEQAGEHGKATESFRRAVDHCRRLVAKTGDPTFPGTSRLGLVDALLADGKPAEAAVALGETLDEVGRLARLTPDAVTLCRRVVERADRLAGQPAGEADADAIRRRAQALIEGRSGGPDAGPADKTSPGGLLYRPAGTRPGPKRDAGSLSG